MPYRHKADRATSASAGGHASMSRAAPAVRAEAFFALIILFELPASRCQHLER